MSKPIRKAAVPAFAAVLLAACIGFVLFFVTLPSPEPFRHQNPSTTALMDARAAEVKAHHH
ncbi:MAG: hypothetical protein ACJ79V_08265, partial [Myxococcales bacterium]